ncbi:CPBP family intramembrane glutamic endopeptidase [Lutibacter sp.]|uniref:CPBP family intramembrane glutamic endopeptidase n=1 Tax=Lutibacter sp. TaxID=1925666 RepID=UPI002734B1CE|nr:CPBP family intramembrane glutamic endopeptidase [Lutibacter sp.]MDP3313991.1 CPBP family intramembrane metalloprotease [Lutibacter sp.]
MKFIQQAYKGNNEGWSYFGTLFIFFFGWQFFGVIPLVVTAYIHANNFEEFINSAENTFTTVGINANLYLFMVILSFAIGLIFLILGILNFHKRKLISVITSRANVDWNRIFYAFFFWALMGFVTLSFSYFYAPEDYVWNFKPIPFLILVIISFLFLPIQTSMEEILFRGYLMQGIGVWFKNAWVPLVLTSLIFGLLHGLNPEVAKLGKIILIFYIGTGLLLGIITLMDEGTELALGFHAANNIVAAVLVTSNWMVFQTDALFVDISEPSVNFEMFLPVFFMYPLVIWIFAKKYKWTNWKEKLIGKVENPLDNVNLLS